MRLIEALHWRYASKRMNGQQVPVEKLETILDSIRLAPTSLGLQPFQVVVISDQSLKQTIFETACQQPQIVECSDLLVFAARTDITEGEIEEYMQLIAQERNIPVESLSNLRNMVSSVKDLPADRYFQWAARQAYIAFGIGIVAAATEQVDATPIEGFAADKMDEILDLEKLGLRSVVVLTLGYRHEEKDYLANAKKVRKPAEALFIKR